MRVPPWVAMCFLMAGSGCNQILGFSDPTLDAGDEGDGGAIIDAADHDAIPEAACEFGEPNDNRTVATPLAPITGQSAGICGTGDRDFYSIHVADGQQLVFMILFAQEGGSGDLDMRLLDVDGNIVARSLSTDPDESIVCPGASPSCPVLTGGNYFMEVFGFSPDVQNGYTINFELNSGALVDAKRRRDLDARW